jgi:predicted DNA-binding transcriptional regulator AlpA
VNRQQLMELPPAVDVPTAAAALGLSRTAAYELIRAGAWPTPIFRLGRLIRVPTAPLLALLGLEPSVEATQSSPARGREIAG